MADEAVVFVHGWGGSFVETWQKPGWEALLNDVHRRVIGVDLLGHGTAPKPHDVEAYDDLTKRIVDALPGEAIAGVGFSLGAMTLLDLAGRQPQRFTRLVVAGVGSNLFRDDDDHRAKIVAAIEGTGDADDVHSQLFAQYAHQAGNDPVALACIMSRPVNRDGIRAALGNITCPVLVVLGDKDFAGPADALLEALPNPRLVTLRNTDHFATTESFACIDAVLEFLEAVPG